MHANNHSSTDAASTADPAPMDARTRMLLQAPVTPTLLRLAIPNIVVLGVQAGVGLVETWFVGRLGTNALAGMALVFPIVMLMQMASAGAVGGGMASAIARALGRGQRQQAEALVWQSLAIAVGLGLVFTVAMALGGRWLYSAMGGRGAALDAALLYSHWMFAGAVLVWVFNALSAVIRGTGNMLVPAIATVAGAAIVIPLSPLLIFGWGPVPGMGIAGGALAMLLYYLLGSVFLWRYLRSPRSLLQPRWQQAGLQWPLMRGILAIGLLGTVSSAATNLCIGVGTAFSGRYGEAAIAGYGTASRIEYLLVPLVFGLGAPLVAMIGTCIGAGQRERALRAAWTGAALAFGMTSAIGIAAALYPQAWLGQFSQDPAMMEAGSQYLRMVGPFYGFFGVGLVLYFASQGAGRLMWPVMANLARLLVVVVGGWAAMHWGAGLQAVFAVQGVALVVYGGMTAWSIARGAWFAPRR